MKLRTLLFLTALSLALVLSGCASTATSPTNANRDKSQPRYVPRTIPTLTAQERLLLSGNGYAVGIWAEKCGDTNALNERYYEDGEKVMSDVTKGGKSIRRSEFYDVREVSKGVIRFKTYGKDFVRGQEFVSETKSGVVGDKRMIFDQSIVLLGGQTAGKQLLLIKDGYEVTDSSGAPAKGKRAPIMVRCP